MKLTNMVIGLIAFSVIVSMFFLLAGDILYQNEIEEYEGFSWETFNTLGGNYKSFQTGITDKDSTIRDMEDAAQSGEGVETDEPDVSALKGTLSAAKMTVNFYSNFENIINNATADINTEGQTYIHPIIKNGILAAILIILIFILIHFIWRFKTET